MSNDAAGPLKTVQGEFEIGSQYHFHLEPHSCLVRPLEDGQYEVISATQTVYKVQATVAKALAMPENAFDLRYSKQGCQMAKFDPFLSLECARVEGVGAQSKERKGSNFAAQRSGAIVQRPEGLNTYDSKNPAIAIWQP